ncbi:TRAP transporter small permease [Desulfoscipio geothermicus]|uniref:TRAP-type C4-dicarboxylate transport system, small permease component n=1 Tax=Desulfoscipio geothermicus DSM 3669 TaxID=1121426 RepID=A0A1I6DEJ3_9FIRM|nr:TRAP transporter small permease [Desulfoscipio geothermicus]SFR03879.1 TRAP-type C4-dicarboxylate transport system, small permease component [Desulfoscipio geothermicus DSM 3669]
MEIVMKILTTILMVLLVVILTASVTLRYCFNSPIAFAEESTRYILVWMSFLGAGLATKRDAHLRVDALVTRLPGRLQFVFGLLNNLISMVFLTIGVYFGVKIVISAHTQISDVLRINISYVYLAVVLGFMLMIFHILKNTYYSIKKGPTI